MRRTIFIFLIGILVLAPVGCTSQALSHDTAQPGDATPSAAPIPGGVPSEPIPTTPPDVETTAPDVPEEPEQTPAPSSPMVHAGIVKNSGEIIGTGVAFRKEPNKDSEVINKLDNGTFVKILKTNVNAQWHQVEYDGQTGYINRMYLRLNSSMDGYKIDYVGTIINCENDVNVREEPSTDAKVIGVAKKGDSLSIVPQDTYIEGWYTVAYQGQSAYISADYIDIDAVVDDNQLADLTVKGGMLYPTFSPNEYGYVIKATAASVTITAKANDGVAVSVGDSGESSATVEIPASGMKTVRISLNGEIRYSLYISRNILTVGTWNIKRGDGKLLNQGRLIFDQQPDILGVQEAYQKLNAKDIVDNLASIKTKEMSHNVLSPTIDYSDGGEYGNGLISRYDMTDIETFPLDSGGSEPRLLQKAVMTIDGKAVSFYNTHFSYNSKAIRDKQFAEVLRIMNKDKNEYKILTGDFNAKFSEFAVFNKKYTVVNTDETKYYDYSRNEIDYSELDNIIVTKNIKVVNSRIVVTSFSDHYPVFAYLMLE